MNGHHLPVIYVLGEMIIKMQQNAARINKIYDIFMIKIFCGNRNSF